MFNKSTKWDRVHILQTNTFSFSVSELASGIIHGHKHFRTHFGFWNIAFYAEMSLVLLKMNECKLE